MLHKFNILKWHPTPSKVFLKWICSYIVILIIPLLIGSIYYSHSYKVIKNEIMVRQHLSLNNVSTQLENYLSNLIRISTNLKMNRNVNSLSYKIDPSPDFQLNVKRLKDDLSVYMITNSFIKETYVYFPNSDYIVSSSTVYKNEYTDYMPSRYISKKTWQFLSDNLYLNSYIFDLADQDDEKLLLSFPLIVNRKTESPLSIIVFELNRTSFNSLLEDQLISYDFSELTLMKDNTILLSSATNPVLAKQLKPSDVPQDSSSITMKPIITLNSGNNRKDDYIIDTVNLFLSDTKLVSLTEVSLYNNITSHMLIILFIVLFVSILLGFIITVSFSVVNYRPLKEIMGYIKENPSDKEEKNEYSKIKKIIIKTNTEKIAKQKLLKNDYLYKLLTGDIQLSQVPATIADQFQLNFPTKNLYVVLLRFSEFKVNQNQYNSQTGNISKYELAFFITQNILSELLEPDFPNLHFCNNQAEIAIIVNISDYDEKKEATLLQGLGTFIKYCKNYFEITFYVGISELCSNKHISDAYVQANNTLEYMYLFNTDYLHHYKDTPKESQIGYLDLKNNDYIINLVMSANQQALENYFKNIYQELRQIKLSSEDAKSCLYFFYNVSMRLKARLKYQYPYSSTENIFVLGSPFFNSSLMEAIQYIEKVFLEAIAIIKEQKINSTDKMIHQVTQYIESNYFDINLNLNNIADHFDITPSYLSRKFRKENGISIIDYLYKIRISHSLKLIKDTSLKIYDIAQIVGFQDSNAFIRIFKKYYGCTPGKYKTSTIELTEFTTEKVL